MNWAGLLFGGAMAAALTGAVVAAVTPRLVAAAVALAASGLGVAGLCLALGADLVAIVVAIAAGAFVPSVLLLAATLAPPSDPDVRPAPARRAWVTTAASLLFLALVFVLSRTPWPPAAGPRTLSVEWIGSRLLSDSLPVLVATCALLGLAGVGVVALLRPRARRR